MAATVFTELELAYLADQPLGRLATVARHGQPQASPVSFAWNADLQVLEVGGYRMARTQKFRNVATNDRVALVVDDIVSREPWTVRCLEIRGRAEALEHPERAAISFGDGAIIRIHPSRVISWGIDPDAGSPRNIG